MTQEDKNLLLVDLSARIPYGVKINVDFVDFNQNGVLCGILNEELTISPNTGYPFERNIEYAKPYLFPLTEEILDNAIDEESNRLYKELICIDSDLYKENNKSNILLLHAKLRSSVIKYFHINHIDYNGLIGKGLAIDATNLNIY